MAAEDRVELVVVVFGKHHMVVWLTGRGVLQRQQDHEPGQRTGGATQPPSRLPDRPSAGREQRVVDLVCIGVGHHRIRGDDPAVVDPNTVDTRCVRDDLGDLRTKAHVDAQGQRAIE